MSVTATAPPPYRAHVDPWSAVAGNVMRALREARGWTYEDLAARAAMSPAMVKALEKGWRNFTMGTLARAARALGVQPWVLLKPDDFVCSLCGNDPEPGYRCDRCGTRRPA